MLTEKPLYFSTLPEQHYDPVKNPSIQRNEPILGGNDTDSAQKLSPFLLHSSLEIEKNLSSRCTGLIKGNLQFHFLGTILKALRPDLMLQLDHEMRERVESGRAINN